MYKPDARKVQRVLQTQYRYPAGLARRVAENTPPLHDQFAPAIEAWLNGRELPDITIEGITLSEVVRNRQCTPLAAAQMMQNLLDQSMSSEKRQSTRRMLKTRVVRG